MNWMGKKHTPNVCSLTQQKHIHTHKVADTHKIIHRIKLRKDMLRIFGCARAVAAVFFESLLLLFVFIVFILLLLLYQFIFLLLLCVRAMSCFLHEKTHQRKFASVLDSMLDDFDYIREPVDSISQHTHIFDVRIVYAIALIIRNTHNSHHVICKSFYLLFLFTSFAVNIRRNKFIIIFCAVCWLQNV